MSIIFIDQYLTEMGYVQLKGDLLVKIKPLEYNKKWVLELKDISSCR
jgi:hypothetical protein